MTTRILVADGLPANRLAMKSRLVSACYQVSTASTGQEALRCVSMERPDVVLIGADLPDMLPTALCRMLRNSWEGAKTAILMSARSSERVAALQAGASALIDRHEDEITLMAQIRGLIRNKEAAEVTGLAEPAPGFDQRVRPKAVFVSDPPSSAFAWRQALHGKVDFSIAIADPEKALATMAAEQPPDLYLIAVDLREPEGGMRLMAELRARHASRDAAFVMVLPPGQQEKTAIALDLGAGDVLPANFLSSAAIAEAAVRLETQLARKQEADRMRLEKQWDRFCAIRDPLTNLFNRRYAEPRLEEIAVQSLRNRASFAVLLMDVDHFKRVNDIHGHGAGDAVLAEIALRLDQMLPPDALLSRFGGEEFLMALPNCDEDEALRIADQMRGAMSSRPVALPHSARERELLVTISIGVAVAASDKLTHQPQHHRLLDCADKALLQAKSQGRNQVCLARQAIDVY